MVDLDRYRERSLATWQWIADNWAREREFLLRNTAPVSLRLVERLEPRPGETVLDIACGTGDTGFLAAEMIEPGGRLIETDFSSEMLARAEENARERGIGNAEFRVLNAEEMDLADGVADRVVCRFGYMLMADPARALAETRRVLRPGGRLVLAVWGPPDRNPVFASVGMIMTRLGHVPPPDPGAPSIFALADPDRLRGLLADAGFAEVRIDGVTARFHFESVAELLDLLRDTGGGLAPVLRALAPADLERVRAELEEAFAPYRVEGGGFHLDGLVWCVSAS